jgi:hypothetical protein
VSTIYALFVFEMIIKFSLFICLVFWKSSLHGDHRTSFVYWLCQVLYISVHRCHCWLGFCYFLCCVFFFCFQMLNCTKKGYFVLEFFIGEGNRDIMTKELSLLCLFL